ncbi:hypothetical protein SODG_004162 [Sodalis praecaptivus]
MMYLKVKFIRNTDHPHGRKTLEGYIAAENKTVAKVKAAEYLYEQDGKFAIYYKAPRFEEITQELYISKTEKQLDHVDESAIKQYCALLSLFSEQESYDAEEVRDAEVMISNPEGEESEDVARYDALLQQVNAHRAVMPKDISLDDIKAIALQAYRGGEVRSAYVDKSDANSLISEEKTESPPKLWTSLRKARRRQRKPLRLLKLMNRLIIRHVVITGHPNQKRPRRGTGLTLNWISPARFGRVSFIGNSSPLRSSNGRRRWSNAAMGK